MSTPAVTRTFEGVSIPETGTFALDQNHTTVGFVARHLMVSKVRGSFTDVTGAITLAENPLESSVEATINAASITTGAPDRDNHLRSADFLDVETYPTLTFRSTAVKDFDGSSFVLVGDLTIRGVTKPVSFEFEFGGFGTDPWGNYKAGATAKTVVNREEFGLTWNAALETGGVLVGKDVTITLDLQGALKKD